MIDTEFTTFIRSCILHEQTEVVNFLINNEKSIDLTECMHNMELFTVRLPEGEKIMGSTVFYRQLDNMNPNYDETLILCYERAEFEPRNIYFWILIPFWLSEKLINLGEPVFRHYGCSWWGIYDLQHFTWYDRKTLRTVYNELFPT